MSRTVQPVADYPVNPDFDPLDPDYLADPYPYFAKFRRETPVFYAPKIDFWVVSRYEDILNIVKDSETFSNARVQEPLYPLTEEALASLKEGVRVTPTTSTADPPLHRRTRKHAARAFSAKRVAGLEGRIREIANGLIDQMISDGRADMVERFAFPLPASVVFSLIGYPEEDTEMLKSWCFDRLKITWGRPLPEEQLEAVEKMASFFDYIENFVHERAKDLQDDYTSDLLRIRAEDEDNLSLEEVVSIDYSLSFAGHETTTNLILNGLRQLLGWPGLWDELCEDPSLIENPDEFDIRRENASKHIAFSHGIHFCLGAPLARLEARVAFELLTQRLPDLRLSPPDQEFEFDPNMSFRGPKEMWAEWTPVEAATGATNR